MLKFIPVWIAMTVGISVVYIHQATPQERPKQPAEFTLPPPPQGYVCFKTPTPPKMDGKLDDAVWKNAPWTADFVDIEGDKKPKPKYRTHVKMLWDDQGIYFGVELEDPHIWATVTEHDAYIYQTNNDFEVFIDPNSDNQLYAELEMNALNTTWDLLLTRPYRNKGQAIDQWEIKGMKTAVHIDGTLNNPADVDQRWTIEIFWPWKNLTEIGLRGVPKDGEQLRVNFSRVHWDITIENGKYQRVPKRPEDNWVWSPTGKINMHMPERWGYVQLSTKPAGPVEFVPNPHQREADILHEYMQRQAAYYDKHAQYAVDPKAIAWPNNLPTPSQQLTFTGYEAQLATKQHRCCINHEGKFTASKLLPTLKRTGD